MIEIGSRPLLWHIMKIYGHYGINDFIICCGYKGYIIKEYFANYFLHMSDVTFDMSKNGMIVHEKHAEPWKVTLVDTGDNTMTGGRLKRVASYLEKDERFCFTYGDGVADINIGELIDSHKKSKKIATVTAVQLPGRFGSIDVEGNRVKGFVEKPRGDGTWINGGFFILNNAVFKYLEGDSTSWEGTPLINLAHDGQLNAYFHRGFWRPMDTLRDKNELENLWDTNNAPWKFWS